jgi:GNAT superfamily N-acetyltransferase
MSWPGELSMKSTTVSEIEGDSSLWALYDSAFPAEERDPRAVITNGLARGVVDVVRACVGAALFGFAIVHRLQQLPVAFLVYLAVIPEARGRGIGQALFHEVERRSPGGVVWEIDVPSLAPNATERRIRERRKLFFERLGGTVVSTSYLQPPINSPHPVPMLLMASGPARNSAASDLIDAVYRDKYVDLNGVDAGLVSALRARIA